MTDRVHGVVLVGDGDAATELLAAGIHDFVIFDREVVSSVFDDATDTWTLATETARSAAAGSWSRASRRSFRWFRTCWAAGTFAVPPCTRRCRPTSSTRPVNESRSSAPTPAAGELIDRMAGAGATLEVFALPPRRDVQRLRRTLRLPRRRRVKVITSPIEEVTAVGVRTVDGVHHDADAIVYGTGFAVRAGLPQDTLLGAHGLSIQQAWVDGAEPYRGMAVHGFPNYFTVGGPHFAAAMRYVVECLRLLGTNSRDRGAPQRAGRVQRAGSPASTDAAPRRLCLRRVVVRSGCTTTATKARQP